MPETRSISVTTAERSAQELAGFDVNFDLPTSLEEAAKMYGDDVVLAKAISSITVDLQSFLRSKIKAGEKEDAEAATSDSLQAAIDTWKPGVKPRGKSKAEKTRELFIQMSPEEKKALLAELKDA